MSLRRKDLAQRTAGRILRAVTSVSQLQEERRHRLRQERVALPPTGSS
jgi:hypothetical protein